MKIENSDQVVILDGGFAKRLGNITKKKPKSLLLYKKKPFIYQQINYFYKRGIRNILILISHQGQKIKKEISRYKFPNLNIKFNHDGKKNLGTGGALKKAKNYRYSWFKL